MVGDCPDDMHPIDLGCHKHFAHLRVDEVDAYHAESQNKGVKRLEGVASAGMVPQSMS